MTEAEQKEVKASIRAVIEKMENESAKHVVEFEARIVELEAEVERKNKALDDLLAENDALKKELAGPKENAVPVPRTPANNTSHTGLSPHVAAEIEKCLKVEVKKDAKR